MRHKIRVIKVNEEKYPYRVQYSPDGLRWTTMEKFYEKSPAIEYGISLDEHFSKVEPMLDVTHILWTSKYPKSLAKDS